MEIIRLDVRIIGKAVRNYMDCDIPVYIFILVGHYSVQLIVVVNGFL